MLAELSLIVSIAGAIPYAYAIITREIKPERVTWGIWTLVLFLAVLAYDAAGGGKSVWFLIGDLLITGFIFVLSLFNGVGGWTKVDRLCLVAALFGLTVWQLSNAPLWQMVGTLTADMIAIVPTIKKSLEDPMSDSPVTFAASSLAALMGVFSVGQWNVLLLFYPVYPYTVNFFTAVVIATGRYYVTHRKFNEKGLYENY